MRWCQRRLFVTWAASSGVLLAIALVQTLPASGVYHDSASAVWDWLLPTLVPTLSLMLGTVVRPGAPDAAATVDAFTYRVAWWASLAYLLVVLVLLFAFATSENPARQLAESGRVVTALYALVGVALGTFFASKR